MAYSQLILEGIKNKVFVDNDISFEFKKLLEELIVIFKLTDYSYRVVEYGVNSICLEFIDKSGQMLKVNILVGVERKLIGLEFLFTKSLSNKVFSLFMKDKEVDLGHKNFNNICYVASNSKSGILTMLKKIKEL